MSTPDSPGIVTRPAPRSVDETVTQLRALLDQRHITLFAVIDHSGEAAKVGLKMPPAKLLIFGNPQAGTPVMLAAPTAALDLPLKILVWQDPNGQTQLSYNDPQYLQNRHHFPPALLPNLTAAATLANQVAP